MGTLKHVTPNLAELLMILPDCTNEDVDEVVRFLRILHRGRASSQGLAERQGLDWQRERSPRRFHRSASALENGVAVRNSTGGVHNWGGHLSSGFPQKGKGKSVKVQNPSLDYTYYGKEIEQEVINEVETALMSAGTNPAEARAAYSLCQENPKLYPGLFAIFGRFCRNCFLGGCGFINTPQHTVAECKALGNPCWVECRNCSNGVCHWIDDCPVRLKVNQGAAAAFIPTHQIQVDAVDAGAGQ